MGPWTGELRDAARRQEARNDLWWEKDMHDAERRGCRRGILWGFAASLVLWAGIIAAVVHFS